MSGLGGGGYMLVRPAGEAQSYAVSFGMVAPGALDPADYPLTGEAGADLFGWPAVEGDRNTRGPFAVAVPGQVAGLALARERFGSWGWADLVAPACALAERGMEVDWHATVAIAASAPELAQDPGCAATYLADGFPLATPWTGDAPRIRLGSLAETLRRLAEAGPADFYTGEIARAICADMAALGGRLSDTDLADYAAQVEEAPATRYRDALLLSFLADFGMSPDDAAHCPRINVDGPDLVEADARLPAETLALLEARFALAVRPHGVHPSAYACPNAVVWDPQSGTATGVAHVMSPNACSQTRIGMITPSLNTVLEPVTYALLSDLPDVTAHFSRVRVTHISLGDDAASQFADEPMLAAARMLADARVHAICWNGTAGSWLGPDFDRRLCEAIARETGIPATSATLALAELFRSRGISASPW
ncbi:Glutathione hydrolase 2 [Geodia barretti]|uniref:Glutathione hydrolase 2 n=1 Tax=Geodia barretti TaxID=519541 RepID=A0AA35XLF6_GEOBA|nr:Glutathione hydrolase 2 [Geodia barretti]